MDPVTDGAEAGTDGKSLRMEAIKINLVDLPGYTVKYKAHVQNDGWQDWKSDGEIAGTTNRSLRMEALEIKVEKTDAEKVAEANAETAVAKAEKSGDQTDVDAAKAAVANVQATTEKAAFTARINAINAKLEVANVTADNAVTVKVAFNKQMDAATASNKANYTVSGANINKATLSDDKTTVTLSLDPSAPLANNHAAYPITVSKNVLAATGDAMAANYTTNYTFSDTTAPTLGAVSYPDNNTAKVSFSEPMAALSAANVKVFDANGVDVTGSKVTANPMATGDTDLTLNIASADLNKPYTVYVYEAADLATNYAGTKSFTITKTNADKTVPAVTSLKAIALDTFVVTFSEPVKNLAVAPATNYASYTVDNASVTPTSETPNADGTQVTVKLATPFVTGGMHDVKVSNAVNMSGTSQDTAYDKMIDFEANTTTSNVTSANVQTIDGADYLVVKYDDPSTVLNTAADAPTGNVVEAGTVVKDSVEKPSSAFGTATPYDSNGDGTPDAIKIAIPAGLNAGTYTTKLAAKLVVNAVGNESKETPITFNYAGTVAPTVKPTVSSVATTTKYVTVTFGEDVTAATALNTNNYAVDGQNIFSSAIFEENTHTVKLILKANSINANSPRLFTVNNVADANGNVMDAYSDGTIAFKDNTAPKIVSAQLTDANTLVLTFNKNVEGTSGVNENDFDVYVGGTKVGQSAATGLAANTLGTTVTLKLTTALTAADLSNAITVTPSANNDVVDANGNAFNTPSITVSHN